MKRHSVEMDVSITADRKTGKFEVLKGFYNCNGGGRENLSVAVSHVAARGAQSIYYFPKSDLTARYGNTRCGSRFDAWFRLIAVYGYHRTDGR